MSSSQRSPYSIKPLCLVPRIIGAETAWIGGWLEVERRICNFPTHYGPKTVRWECIHRTGSSTAVTIILYLLHPNGKRSVVLNEEWRAPIDNICVGWPGGLVDEGEDIRVAALRELAEETGLNAKSVGPKGIRVIDISPPTAEDAGMTDATTRTVEIEVEWPENVELPVQSLEEDEYIKTRIVPLSVLHLVLEEYAETGYIIDSQLASFARGLRAFRA